MATGFTFHLGGRRPDPDTPVGHQQFIRLSEFFRDQAVQTIFQFNMADRLSALSHVLPRASIQPIKHG